MKFFLVTLIIFVLMPVITLGETNPFTQPVDTDTGQIETETNPFLGDVDTDTGQLKNPPTNPLLEPYDMGGGPFFGGRLTGVFYCNCSNSLLLFIQDYKSGGLLQLVYGPGSNLIVGSPFGLYQLGSYSGGGQCLFYVGTGCSSWPNNGLIGGGSPGFGTS